MAAAVEEVVSGLSVMSATAKLTISVKRRLSNGDEIFIAPGIEINCAAEELDAKQGEVTERVNAWMDTLLEAYPDAAEGADDGVEDEEGEADAEDDADAEDEEALDEDAINAMSKKDLLELIETEGLDVENAAKLSVQKLRAAVIELMSEDEDGEGDEDGDEDGDGDDEDGDGEEDDSSYTAEDLKKMKLAELQEITAAWEIGDPAIKKGADLKTKTAAYVKHILAAQNEE